MNPTQLLLILVIVTAASLTVQLRGRARRGAALRVLAGRHKLHYSARDRFGLAPRVARHFPVPGAADVRVADLLYRSDDTAGHVYVFTVDYTRGVLGSKRRARAVVLMTEPRPSAAAPQPEPILRTADATLPAIAQYESLLG